MSKRSALAAHCVALALLGAWGLFELGLAGTLTIAFWFAWLVYAALVALMHSGIRIGGWLSVIPPALWVAFSGADIVPQARAAFTGGDFGSPALMGAILVTLPCAAAVMIHLWYATVSFLQPAGSASRQESRS